MNKRTDKKSISIKILPTVTRQNRVLIKAKNHMPAFILLLSLTSDY